MTFHIPNFKIKSVSQSQVNEKNVEVDVRYIPQSRRFTSVDSFLLIKNPNDEGWDVSYTLLGFQCTLTQSHPIMVSGLIDVFSAYSVFTSDAAPGHRRTYERKYNITRFIVVFVVHNVSVLSSQQEFTYPASAYTAAMTENQKITMKVSYSINDVAVEQALWKYAEP